MKSKTYFMAWLKAALIRAIRTFAQAMLSYIGPSAILLGDVNWKLALSAGAMGFILSIIFALAGLPEVKEEEINDSSE